MEKILTLFARSPENMKLVTRTVNEGCDWVLAGEGTPTRKRDGTNVRVHIERHGITTVGSACQRFLTTRVSLDKRRNPTREGKAAGAEPGYVPADPNAPEDKYLYAALTAEPAFDDWPAGWHPCEALGPKIQGGAEGGPPRLYPFLLRPEVLDFPPPWTFDTIRDFLAANVMEGIVWHRRVGGRILFAKIKRRDFNLPWPVKAGE